MSKSSLYHYLSCTLVHWLRYNLGAGRFSRAGGGNQDERVPYLIIWPDYVHPFTCHVNNTQGTIFSALIHVNVNQDKRVPYFISWPDCVHQFSGHVNKPRDYFFPALVHVHMIWGVS